jgi:hypothetical protein
MEQNSKASEELYDTGHSTHHKRASNMQLSFEVHDTPSTPSRCTNFLTCNCKSEDIKDKTSVQAVIHCCYFSWTV